jgi:adenylosuccinate synthase
MLSGVTRLIITKADVMDEFEEIKMATAYKVGETVTEEMPFDICDMAIEPVYQSFPGWTAQKISACTSLEHLPETFTEYCKFIENYLGTRVQYVSNGTGRDNLMKFF